MFQYYLIATNSSHIKYLPFKRKGSKSQEFIITHLLLKEESFDDFNV